MSKKIGIAGMGWLGMPLAQRLHLLGFQVKGTVTQSEKATSLRLNGFDVYTILVTEKGIQGDFQGFLQDIDTLIVMIPPGLRRHSGGDYVMKMTHFVEGMEQAKIKKCIFISSTSVYGDAQGQVTEADIPVPESEAGRQLLQVEQLFFHSSFQTTIIRFGGLMGGSRQPVRFLAGRDDLSGGKAPVNLIHREDCIGIILTIIKESQYGHIFNAVYPDHPFKEIYYKEKALELGLQAPEYREDPEPLYKEVHSINIPNLLGYEFKQPI